MVQINWERVRERPFAWVWIAGVIGVKSVRYIIWRAARIFTNARLPPLSAAIGYIICGVCSARDRILIEAPQQEIEKTTQISTSRFSAFVLSDQETLSCSETVLLYFHGGGFAVGHPLQYRSAYRRWRRKAKEQGLDLSVVAVKYPLSELNTFPAQLDAVIAAYEYLITQLSIDPQRICIAGDSAGGNLAAAMILQLRALPQIPQPSCVGLLSPWLDLSLSFIRNSPYLDRDVLVNPEFMSDYLVPPYTGNAISPKNPLISPVWAEDLSNLPPQFVNYGDLEVMQEEIELWIQKCGEAGSMVTVHRGKGALHGYGVGGLLASPSQQSHADKALLSFLCTHLKKS